MGAETKHQLAPPSKEANKYIRKLKVCWAPAARNACCSSTHKYTHSAPVVPTAPGVHMQEHLLQPSRKHYSGMGYAKESVFLQLDDPDYDAKFGHIWEEHVPGFSGKVRSLQLYTERSCAASTHCMYPVHLRASALDARKYCN